MFYHRIWSLAALYAYRAFGGQDLLDMAVSVWTTTNNLLITPEYAANQSHPLKDVSISSTCNGGRKDLVLLSSSRIAHVGTESTAGGVFTVSEERDLGAPLPTY